MSKQKKPTTTSKRTKARDSDLRKLGVEAITTPFRRATREQGEQMLREAWSAASADGSDIENKRRIVQALVHPLGFDEGLKQARLAGAWPCGDVVQELAAMLPLQPDAQAKVWGALRVAYREGFQDGVNSTKAWRRSATKAATKTLVAKSQKRYETIAKHYRSQDKNAPVMGRLQATAKRFDVSINTVRNAIARTS